jgi:hypothetical protein
MHAALAGDLQKHLEIVPFGRGCAGLTLPHRPRAPAGKATTIEHWVVQNYSTQVG